MVAKEIVASIERADASAVTSTLLEGPSQSALAAPAAASRAWSAAMRHRLAVLLPIALIVLVGIGLSLFRATPDSRPDSIAVLPFADLSSAGDAEYFGDGIAEELMARLARIEGVRVVGRTSAFAFKGKAVDIREIGATLGAQVVLTGSVREADSTVRIIAQLVDVGTGYELWSDSFERPMRDVFAIQDEISKAIASKLDSRLAGTRPASDAQPPVEDPESYNLYLRGRFEWHKRTERSLLQAAAWFREAAQRSPGYARAWAGIGDAEAVLGFYDYLPPREAFPRAAPVGRLRRGAQRRQRPAAAASQRTEGDASRARCRPDRSRVEAPRRVRPRAVRLGDQSVRPGARGLPRVPPSTRDYSLEHRRPWRRQGR
jgi:TolB-like protein